MIKKAVKTKNSVKTKPKFEFTINRDKWTTGTLNAGHGQMCAMGHLCKAIGMKDTEINGGFPNLMDPVYKAKWGELGFLKCVKGNAIGTGLMNKVASANDGYSGVKRETRLKQIFNSAGIKLTFTGNKKA